MAKWATAAERTADDWGRFAFCAGPWQLVWPMPTLSLLLPMSTFAVLVAAAADAARRCACAVLGWRIPNRAPGC